MRVISFNRLSFAIQVVLCPYCWNLILYFVSLYLKSVCLHLTLRLNNAVFSSDMGTRYLCIQCEIIIEIVSLHRKAFQIER